MWAAFVCTPTDGCMSTQLFEKLLTIPMHSSLTASSRNFLGLTSLRRGSCSRALWIDISTGMAPSAAVTACMPSVTSARRCLASRGAFRHAAV
eukprot:123429-Pyramimonas_sp.AAC.1